MKYVITGGAGHISRPLAEALHKAGHQVTLVGRDEGKLKPLTDLGIKAAIGSVEDAHFLTGAFAGAAAIYLMIPPNFSVSDWRTFQHTVANNYVLAIKANHIKNVVVLSSIGAHMGNGAGPVDGLADLEALLKTVEGLNVKVLRPSYFMYNLFGMIPMMKNMQIMGSNFGGTGDKLALVHTNDIAAVAAEELLALNFTGQSIRYIAGDEKTSNEIATILNQAANTSSIPWVLFSDEQALEGMKESGLPATFATGYTTMGKAIREGKMQEDYWKNRPTLSPTKLVDFAKEFGVAFAANN